MKQQWKLIVLLILVILIVVFALQNTNVVEVDLFLGSFPAPLVIIILVSVLIGVVIGLFASFLSTRNNRQTIKKLTKEIEKNKDKKNQELREKDLQIGNLRDKIRDLEANAKHNIVLTDNENSLNNPENMNYGQKEIEAGASKRMTYTTNTEKEEENETQ